ncbi:hypothetical protein FZ103_10535 [Streptomonospora sp. PA3]|uniref:hypothetical protein n=1 Tax=Streptomonospora sp. PA3 TaxID=2607326 RepID=UPI0012DBCCAB|nr:hypothetical protein [Streptomonospora sp. PA3]MUL41607.1 hypothetical protein [Streptomonospora sp. PA3]
MLDLDAPAAARQPLRGPARAAAEQEFLAFVTDRGYLPPPSAIAFAAWLSDTWDDFVESDWSLSTGFVLHSALEYWCNGADPTRCGHGRHLGQVCPDCAARRAPYTEAPA